MPKIPTRDFAPWDEKIKQRIESRLCHRDLANLRASGLCDATIEASKVYSELDPKKVSKLIRWSTTLTGMVFPFHELDGSSMDGVLRGDGGTFENFARVRPHTPRSIKGKPAKYEQPLNSLVKPYFPPLEGSLKKLLDGRSPIFVCEGEKKALALAQLDLAAVGLTGFYNWKLRGTGSLLPELTALNWHRKVFIVFDYDVKATTRKNADGARRELATTLRLNGATRVYDATPSPGPNDTKQGIDDYLVGGGSLADLIHEAQSKPVPNYVAKKTEYAFSELEGELCIKLGKPDGKRNWPCPGCGGAIYLREPDEPDEPDPKAKVRIGCRGCNRFRGDLQDFRREWRRLVAAGRV